MCEKTTSQTPTKDVRVRVVFDLSVAPGAGGVFNTVSTPVSSELVRKRLFFVLKHTVFLLL